MAYHTMTPREEAAWVKAVVDGTLWEYQDEWEASEQMWLWRQSMYRHTLKEIARIYGVTPGTVWARCERFKERK